MTQDTSTIRIVVKKGARRLEVIDGGELRKAYRIALGFDPNGGKQAEGDGKTPEGAFYIFTKNPKSNFTLSLGVSYPSSEDAARGLEHGLITNYEFDEIVAKNHATAKPPQKTALGGEIYIHGGGLNGDWTQGCIAMSDEDIRELFELIERGTRVEIRP